MSGKRRAASSGSRGPAFGLRNPAGCTPVGQDEQSDPKDKEETMAERHRSKDGSRDSDRIEGEPGGASHSGRAGGRLSRQIGTRDEEKRAVERPAGRTRVRKSDEKDEGEDNG